jgi:hypothetical protein
VTYNMRAFLTGLVLLAIATSAFAAPAVTLTATASSTLAPANVTLTWVTSEVGTCTASGGWSGPKAAAGGTEVISNVLGTTSYLLTCSSATGTATVRWTAPTQNVDGSPLTDLAGYELYRATSFAGCGTAPPTIIDNAMATSYVVTGLPTGNWHFCMKAFNTAGVRSIITGTVMKTITTQTVNASVDVTLEQRPKPPSLLTVEVMVYEITTDQYGVVRLGSRVVGSVPLNTECLPGLILASFKGDMYAVPRSAVTLKPKIKVKSEVLVAHCSSVV